MSCTWGSALVGLARIGEQGAGLWDLYNGVVNKPNSSSDRQQADSLRRSAHRRGVSGGSCPGLPLMSTVP